MLSARDHRIAALPPHLQEELRRRQAGQATQSDPIPPADRTKPLPLSFSQQRLWFLDEFQRGAAQQESAHYNSAQYNSGIALRLRGPLQTPALIAAVRELVARHESLRTTFEEVDGKGTQVVAPALDLAVPVVELPGAATPTDAALGAVLSTEYGRPFDLRRGPLFRALLVRLAGSDSGDEGEHVLLLTAHHIVTDGASMDVLIKELGALYTATTQGGKADLPALPVQYADFAAWQRERLSGQALEKQLDYWRSKLDGVAPLELPTDRPRPPVHTNNGAQLEFRIPAGVTAQLSKSARQQGATLYMT
ncbi:MAG: condensation domain-containing protein, partial [Actinomycetes bacterium]